MIANTETLPSVVLRFRALIFFLPVHSLASGGRAARSASCSLTSVRAQTPAAAFGTQCFVLVMLTNRTAFAPLAPILDYTMPA